MLAAQVLDGGGPFQPESDIPLCQGQRSRASKRQGQPELAAVMLRPFVRSELK